MFRHVASKGSEASMRADGLTVRGKYACRWGAVRGKYTCRWGGCEGQVRMQVGGAVKGKYVCRWGGCEGLLPTKL